MWKHCMRTHTHTVPRDNTAVLTQWRLGLACIFLYLTDNSRVTPTVPFICFHNTLKMWSEWTGDPLQLCSSRKTRFLRFAFKSESSCVGTVSFFTLRRFQRQRRLPTHINPDPTLLWSHVLNSVTRILVLFRLLECYKRVYIFHPRNTQARWSSPCARSAEPEANWRAAGKGLQKDEKGHMIKAEGKMRFSLSLSSSWLTHLGFYQQKDQKI